MSRSDRLTISLFPLCFKPAEFKRAQLIFDTVPVGDLKGFKRCGIGFFDNTDKKNKTTLQNPVRRKSDNANDFVEDPEDDLCTYRVLERHLSHLPSDYSGYLFLHEAPKKVLNKRIEKGLSPNMKANFELDKNGKPLGKIGKNYANQAINELATICGFTPVTKDNKKFTGRSARRTASTKMASAGVAPAEQSANMRHQNINTTKNYQDRNPLTHQQRYIAMLGRNPAEKQNSSTSKALNSKVSFFRSLLDIPSLFSHLFFCYFKMELDDVGEDVFSDDSGDVEKAPWLKKSPDPPQVLCSGVAAENVVPHPPLQQQQQHTVSTQQQQPQPQPQQQYLMVSAPQQQYAAFPPPPQQFCVAPGPPQLQYTTPAVPTQQYAAHLPQGHHFAAPVPSQQQYFAPPPPQQYIAAPPPQPQQYFFAPPPPQQYFTAPLASAAPQQYYAAPPPPQQQFQAQPLPLQQPYVYGAPPPVAGPDGTNGH